MINIHSDDLQKLYIAYFGRPADPSGLNYWISRPNESLTLRSISNQLSFQEEYINYMGNKSLELQINQLYLNLFNRNADFDSLNHWLSIVNQKKIVISDIVFQIVDSQKQLNLINLVLKDKDINVLKNKIEAAELFTNQIRRSVFLIDLYKPDSISPWVSGNSLVKASNFLSKLLWLQ